MKPLILSLLLLAGCAGRTIDPDNLRGQGYVRIPMSSLTTSGERKENPNYELWVREGREAGRGVDLCLAPKIQAAEYWWRITVSIDEKETWSNDSETIFGPPFKSLGADCITSPPLPQGRISYRVYFQYRAVGG
ncbi:MAG TPA: hypothetical protein VLT62_17295 [Candidatus Methylomirabilis sp.]|nr:hypothetical protein [Candidatus Methylomirabilis sp.]